MTQNSDKRGENIFGECNEHDRIKFNVYLYPMTMFSFQIFLFGEVEDFAYRN